MLLPPRVSRPAHTCVPTGCSHLDTQVHLDFMTERVNSTFVYSILPITRYQRVSLHAEQTSRGTTSSPKMVTPQLWHL